LLFNIPTLILVLACWWHDPGRLTTEIIVLCIPACVILTLLAVYFYRRAISRPDRQLKGKVARRWLNIIIGWIAALLMLIWRLTCRSRFFDDPRPELRAAQRCYIYALLHAHQAAAVFANDDRCMAAMVSRSADGELLVPSLRLRRVKAVRGSTRIGDKDKGGREALDGLAQCLRSSVPALLTVDGPRGPRNHVHRGVVDLALATNCPILPAVVIPSRRWFLSRTWDRFQIPKPFCTIRVHFGSLIDPSSFSNPDALQRAVLEGIDTLERRHDPIEAETARSARGKRMQPEA
jgi:hypothetical protein